MRLRLIDEIARVFRHMTRDGGVSISEAHVIDDYGTDDARALARASDTDTDWTQLDPPNQDPGGSALSFMDAIGFRYHVPAWMTWELQHSPYFGVGGSGDWNGSGGVAHAAAGLTSQEAQRRKYNEERFSLFNKAQRRAVARFLALCAIHEPHPFMREDEIVAIRAHWHQYLNGPEMKFLREFVPEL